MANVWKRKRHRSKNVHWIRTTMNHSHSRCRSNRFRFVWKECERMAQCLIPFISLESAISSHGGRLWSYRNIGTNWKSYLGLQCDWNRAAPLVGYACIATTTHCAMAFFERSGGWQTVIKIIAVVDVVWSFFRFCAISKSSLFFVSFSPCCCCRSCLSVLFFLIVETD